MNREDLLTKWADPVKVLDKGFVQILDVMGDDRAIEEAARTSYQAGTRKTSETRGLIRYLVANRHSSPIEMVELKVRVKLPIVVERQWIRHRTACLPGDVPISFDLPRRLENGGRGHYTLTVRELFERWQPTRAHARPERQKNPLYRRERVQGMNLRCMNEETGEVERTNIESIVCVGVKRVVSVEFTDGSVLRATPDHRCLTELGWLTLQEALELDVKFAGVGKSAAPIRQPEPFTEDEFANEAWKPIPGWSGYEVSDLGRVRSWFNTRRVMLDEPNIKEPTESFGYHRVSLSCGGKSFLFGVHKLVLLAFRGPAPDGEGARHLDDCGCNNRLDNLVWGTPLENAADRMKNGGHQRLTRAWVGVVSVQRDEAEEVFDIAVAGPWHNFIAGGVVVHNSVNEMSARYSILPDEWYEPDPEQVCYQSTDNKQGRSGPLPEDEASEWSEEYNKQCANAFYHYNVALGPEDEPGVARETARMVLPLSTYTMKIWKIDAHNLLHFLQLRMDPHAQWEIRQYAEIIGQIVEDWLPLLWEAFVDYRLEAVTFSRMEMEVLRGMLQSWAMYNPGALHPQALPGVLLGAGLTKREIAGFFKKTGLTLTEDPPQVVRMEIPLTPKAFEKIQLAQYRNGEPQATTLLRLAGLAHDPGAYTWAVKNLQKRLPGHEITVISGRKPAFLVDGHEIKAFWSPAGPDDGSFTDANDAEVLDAMAAAILAELAEKGKP